MVPQTYIVAQNPEVLAHLMRENENRGMTPAMYTIPASVFNTVAVEFGIKEDIPDPVLKTRPIPIQSLKKLDPEVPNSEPKSLDSIESISLTESNFSLMQSDSNSRGSSKSSTLEKKSQSTYVESSSVQSFNQSQSSFSSYASSLTRNVSYTLDAIPAYHKEPVLYKNVEVEESLYDFGGENVKSCAHKQPLMVQARPVDKFYQPQPTPQVCKLQNQNGMLLGVLFFFQFENATNACLFQFSLRVFV